MINNIFSETFSFDSLLKLDFYIGVPVGFRVIHIFIQIFYGIS